MRELLQPDQSKMKNVTSRAIELVTTIKSLGLVSKEVLKNVKTDETLAISPE